MLELDSSNYNAGEEAQKAGKIATLGRGSHIPGGWMDAGCLNPALEGVTDNCISLQWHSLVL